MPSGEMAVGVVFLNKCVALQVTGANPIPALTTYQKRVWESHPKHSRSATNIFVENIIGGVAKIG